MATFPGGGRLYKVQNLAATITTAITIIQVKAGPTNPLWIVRFFIGQRNSAASVMERVQLLRKTGAATVSSFTPLLTDQDDPAAKAVGGTTATGINGTAEGTDSDILVSRPFNIQTGYEFIPTSIEQYKVQPGGIIALKFPNAPASGPAWDVELFFCE